MQFRFAICSALLVVATSLPSLASSHARRGPTSSRLLNKRSSRAAAPKVVSQRAIDPERTIAIQSALIKQGYLSGEPTGKWDPETQSALEKMQGENGWQTKWVPDSRAIIKLGLGPSTPGSETVKPVGNPRARSSSPATPSGPAFPAQD